MQYPHTPPSINFYNHLMILSFLYKFQKMVVRECPKPFSGSIGDIIGLAVDVVVANAVGLPVVVVVGNIIG
eukprot:15365198-Ditylum_brightwellii.AAC.1